MCFILVFHLLFEITLTLHLGFLILVTIKFFKFIFNAILIAKISENIRLGLRLGLGLGLVLF